MVDNTVKLEGLLTGHLLITNVTVLPPIGVVTPGILKLISTSNSQPPSVSIVCLILETKMKIKIELEVDTERDHDLQLIEELIAMLKQLANKFN